MIPPDRAASRELAVEDQVILQAYEDAKAAVKAAEERAEKLRQEVINLLGDADVGLVDGRKVVSYGPVESRHVDAQALRVAYPEVYDQVTKLRRAWVLRTSFGPVGR